MVKNKGKIVKNDFSLENEIAKVNKEFGYPSPEPIGHHFCSQCGVIHSDSKHIEKESHWVQDIHGKWTERG